ncbi:hypothetical protein E1B28_004542 [Marasmius oreades]|uniref:GAR domain-containing protein n=1 Tax=Marasmius oreades TaxID=181124 RepID=A0A9P8ACX5_9AGAR|nr:uncharacterized protein E1B28_004542 [Marasmius oreades]KAG7097166.1 hypothetical protein E1B28_004542 [Marasmius oreades]
MTSEEPHSYGPPISLENTLQSIDAMPTYSSSEHDSRTPSRKEETLESHEVIELQTFIERKAWIEEKTRFLEQMPSIEVFVGLDAIKASAEEVPGIPTPAELQHWTAEHDIIEKETEIFDKGELKKLRNFTRAATQRNLSPEDTDLIELTLTTIYELDKLLHLLRDRSENLDLLGIRMTWEEHRISSWKDRRNILEDLNAFLELRARFSPSAYDITPKYEAPSHILRRGSVASIASVASTSSETSLNSPALSRSTRFKLAELLSRDGATLGGRVSSLKHGSVTAAGKALDKLIDQSRKPVPEELLDEQDRLEEKCINEMENIGKFVMNVIMQWRKADEIYIETLKDLGAAQTLLEEIEVANLQHPTSRLCSNFTSRADGLIKRLLLRGNPALPNSSFPRPVHPLFPSQQPFNETLSQSLSRDILSAMDIAKEAEAAAKEYKAKYEAVKRVETLRDEAINIAQTFTTVIDRLLNGVPGGEEGDGSPPSLSSTDCLDPTKHSVFLALLPSIVEDIDKTDKSAEGLLRTLPAAIARIDFPGVESEFRASASTEARRLTGLCTDAKRIRDEVASRVSKLREARKIWSAMEVGLKVLETIRREVFDVIESVRWRQEVTIAGAPPTPESPPSQPLPLSLPEETHGTHFRTRMSELESQLVERVYNPLTVLSETLENPLKESLSQMADGLRSHFDRAQQTINLLDSICRQSYVMTGIRDESNKLQLKVEGMIVRYENAMVEVLDKVTETNLTEELRAESDCLKSAVVTFMEGLGHRIPFVAPHTHKRSFVKRSLSSIDLKANLSPAVQPIELPFDVQSLDAAVRVDCNAYSMRVNGQIRTLEQTMAHFQVAMIGREADNDQSSVLEAMDQADKELSSLKEIFSTIPSEADVLQAFHALLSTIDSSMSSNQAKVQQLLTAHRHTYMRMEEASKTHGSNFQDSLLSLRRMNLDEAEKGFTTWDSDIKSFHNLVSKTRQEEITRLEAERLAEEQRLQLEREHAAAEEAEKVRLENMREEEKRRRHEVEERVREQLRLEKQQADIAEKECLEREAAEQARLEDEERRAEAERQSIAMERAEKARLQQERLDIEARLKLAEGQLAEERRVHAEREKSAREEEEKRTRLAQEEEQRRSRSGLSEDVFGLQTLPDRQPFLTQEMMDLLAQVVQLRKRLRSLNIKEVVRPSTRSSSLPNANQTRELWDRFLSVETDIGHLPETVEAVSVNLQLRSCRAELEGSREMLSRLDILSSFSDALAKCDAALSDLLEHIDSYPSSPLCPLSSSYSCPSHQSAEAQLSGRLNYTRSLIDNLSALFEAISDDHRAAAERDRVLQTWSELQDMGNDRLNGRRSRSNSVASSSQNNSGRNSRSSINSGRGSIRKSNGYAILSVSSSKANAPRGRLKPPTVSARRAFSGSDEPVERSFSRTSVRSSATQRSTSGSSLYGSTFASRQRTTSLTPIAATPPTRVHARSQTSTSQKNRSTSPSVSDASSVPQSHVGRLSTSTSSWSRAPRLSFSTLPRSTSKKALAPRKAYVANPKSKLDVAVGQVVNNLPVGINIEGVAGSWKDQSGKYWIGDKDPKLCFCRILRSQTVMVRVGGGWSELSKFIRDHFADSFRLLNEPALPSREEKWITSATLLEAVKKFPSRAPRTPEPNESPTLLPSFALQTPSGQSPRSLLSTPSTKGSPLTPLQFMRRAEPDAPFFRPETPSRPPSGRCRTPTIPSTPGRQGVWRP